MTEIEALRQEVAELRAEVTRLRGSIFPSPLPGYWPRLDVPAPVYPGGPLPTFCSGQANGIGYSVWNRAS